MRTPAVAVGEDGGIEGGEERGIRGFAGGDGDTDLERVGLGDEASDVVTGLEFDLDGERDFAARGLVDLNRDEGDMTPGWK